MIYYSKEAVVFTISFFLFAVFIILTYLNQIQIMLLSINKKILTLGESEVYISGEYRFI